VGTKRKHEETTAMVNLDTLLSVLSEARVFILEQYHYCIKCKLSIETEQPCKHYQKLD